MSQIVGKVMIKQGFGNIVNTASMSAFIANFQAEQINYYASKAGVVMLTKALAAEWAPYGIRVNAIAPGVVHTDMVEKLGEETNAVLHADMPMHRYANPEEIAGLISYLISDEASYITGQVITIAGGFVI